MTKPLENAGIIYDDVAIYTTNVIEEDLPYGYSDDVDCVAFASGSTVRAFAERNKKLDFTNVKAVCIGNETAKAAREYNMSVYVSKAATLDSLVECIEENFKK